MTMRNTRSEPFPHAPEVVLEFVVHYELRFQPATIGESPFQELVQLVLGRTDGTETASALYEKWYRELLEPSSRATLCSGRMIATGYTVNLKGYPVPNLPVRPVPLEATALQLQLVTLDPAPVSGPVYEAWHRYLRGDATPETMTILKTAVRDRIRAGQSLTADDALLITLEGI